MHLKAVHMENFKSFGRKLTIPFEPGFTGITGPNGSGKSNIGDAILFVLGPNSSRAIRAGRLTDLIFNGGEHGTPAKMCEVTLEFDNADRTMPVDADIVELTRKVKRKPKPDDPDGYSSYYYVNGRASKKKEFVDLLQHARISADGYNITQQGDILQICKMSNVERRKVLDDIAGVTTFDKDLDQAAKRREDVEGNLERIGIVLEELERSLKQLEREKEAAQKFKDLKQEVATTKGLMAHRRKEDTQVRIAEIQTQIERYTEERAGLEEKAKTLKVELKDLQATFAELEQQIREEGGEEVAKVQDDLEKARDKMVRFEEKINYCKESLQDGQDDLLPLQKELGKVEKELERTRKIASETETEHAEAAATLAKKRKELESTRDLIAKSDDGAMALNREMAKLKQEYEEKQLALHETRLELDRLQEKADATAARLEEAEGDLQTARTDRKEVAFQLDEIKEATQGTSKKRKEQQKRLFELKKAQADLAGEAEAIEGRIRRMQRELADLQAKQDAAQAVQGGGRAVQEILKARDDGVITGIVGTIAELAQVDDEYQEALQTAAGGRLFGVVVEDDDVAAQCITMIKKLGAGRATMLPLNKMKPGRPRGQALMKSKQEGSLGFAIDLIQFNERYRNAFWYVFGDTIVAEDMGAGRRMMGGARIVTLDGELFEASGAMTGGQRRQRQSNVFSNADRGRIDELLVKVKQAEDAEEETLERLSEARRELEQLNEELSDEDRSGAHSEERQKDLQKRLERLTEKENAIQEKVDGLRSERDTLAEELDKAQEDVPALEARIEELDKTREEKGKLLLKGSKKELRDKVNALQTEIEELIQETADLKSRKEVAEKQSELVTARSKELKDHIESAGGDRQRYEDDLKRYKDAHKQAKTEVEALLKMERELTGNLRGLQDEKDAVYKQTVDLEARIEKVTDKMETHYGLIVNAKSKLPGLEETLGDAMVELEEHPIKVTDDMEVPPFDDLRRELRNLEGRIDRLGAVNMRALEEFEEQDKRRSDLRAEVERLHEQRDELEKLVAEISQKKKDALMVVFEAVNENFAEVYKKLSMGGKALMELEDPQAPFEGGLILKAQPLGKRVTRLDALSGGEKSLTSMAFIFAIQQFDPSPFYYLDEVDQNLDAVNSELLAKMVKDNSRFAQFIQVSLRKITLKEADGVYGVTQQIAGQSDIIADFDIRQIKDESEKPDHIMSQEDQDDLGRGLEGGDDDGDPGSETLSDTFDKMVDVKVEP